jgi:hypothetical protein
MTDPLAERVIFLAATMDVTLADAADIVADEMTRDSLPPVTVGNVTFVDFLARHQVSDVVA